MGTFTHTPRDGIRGMPSVKTLESFDFSFQPSIKREQIESLHELNFVDRKENIVLLTAEPCAMKVAFAEQRKSAAAG
jgi:IstB-like ATP binding protein